jgi:hypothetical protein
MSRNRIGRDHNWRRVRAQVLKGASVCEICGRALDFDADPRSRWAPSVDHIIPMAEIRKYDLSTQRDMAIDTDLLRPCHYGCNSRRGAGAGKPVFAGVSREW